MEVGGEEMKKLKDLDMMVGKLGESTSMEECRALI
jgi:hypothetical protein